MQNDQQITQQINNSDTVKLTFCNLFTAAILLRRSWKSTRFNPRLPTTLTRFLADDVQCKNYWYSFKLTDVPIALNSTLNKQKQSFLQKNKYSQTLFIQTILFRQIMLVWQGIRIIESIKNEIHFRAYVKSVNQGDDVQYSRTLRSGCSNGNRSKTVDSDELST